MGPAKENHLGGDGDRGTRTCKKTEMPREAIQGRVHEVPGAPSTGAKQPSYRDSYARLNAALRRWSVEPEQVQSVPAAGVAPEPVNAYCEKRLFTAVVEVAPEVREESPGKTEQSAGIPCEQDEMNRAKYRTKQQEAEKEQQREQAAKRQREQAAKQRQEQAAKRRQEQAARQQQEQAAKQQQEQEQAARQQQATEQEQASAPNQELGVDLPEDYYEVLQISRSADLETIHRVYRIMALRFHPDNTKTGNLERFLLLKRAYQVLSDPQQRAAYDAAHRKSDTQPLPHFESKDFVYGVEGEVNRRLGILSLLYHKRRMGEGTAGMSVLDLENRMAFPREYLTFTIWYLRSKHYITLQENSDYALTAEGVDYVESHSMSNRVIRQLLTSGCEEEERFPEERPRNGGTPFDGAQKPAQADFAAA